MTFNHLHPINRFNSEPIPTILCFFPLQRIDKRALKIIPEKC
jgi:hypothetical protein